MGVEQDLQAKLNSNQHTIYITDADELLAAWLYKKSHSGKRSINLNAAPAKFRLSCPPNENTLTMPCHVTTHHKQGRMITEFKSESTIDCHGHSEPKGPVKITLLDNSPLEALQHARNTTNRFLTPILDSVTL